MSSDPMNTDDSQISMLDDILFRFASTSDEKLEPAVDRVLPKILPMLGMSTVRDLLTSLNIASRFHIHIRSSSHVYIDFFVV